MRNQIGELTNEKKKLLDLLNKNKVMINEVEKNY